MLLELSKMGQVFLLEYERGLIEPCVMDFHGLENPIGLFFFD